jgi:hypothetical protein
MTWTIKGRSLLLYKMGKGGAARRSAAQNCRAIAARAPSIEVAALSEEARLAEVCAEDDVLDGIEDRADVFRVRRARHAPLDLLRGLLVLREELRDELLDGGVVVAAARLVGEEEGLLLRGEGVGVRALEVARRDLLAKRVRLVEEEDDRRLLKVSGGVERGGEEGRGGVGIRGMGIREE